MNVESKDKSKASILIVDDILENLRLLTKILKDNGYAVRQCCHSKSVMQSVLNTPPDLILLDIMMPEMDGYMVCEQLKASEQIHDIPVIFISALDNPVDKVKAFLSGGVDYITKPFYVEEVLARVETHLQLQRQKQVITRQKNELAELNANKDRFFSIIAHDLKSPFTILMGVISLMNNKEFTTPEYFEIFYNQLKSATDKTYRLLENLLEWARFEQGGITFEPVEISVKELGIETFELLNPWAASKGVRLINDLTSNVRVIVDVHMITTVIRNLVSNAIKFSKDGDEVVIKADMIDDTFVQIAVEDSGTGISASEMEKLFRIDQKISRHGTAGETGTGLGLILCKEFVEKNGGKIWVKSTHGEGSLFKFTVPIAP